MQIVLGKPALHMQKSLDLYLPLCAKLKQKWIYGLNMKTKTLHLLEKKASKTGDPIGTGKDLLNRTLIAQEITSRTKKWDISN